MCNLELANLIGAILIPFKLNIQAGLCINYEDTIACQDSCKYLGVFLDS